MLDMTVIPSYLGTSVRGEEDSQSRTDNTLLRLGEVKKIVYPGEKGSISGHFVEYAIEVVVKDGNGPPTTTIYVGCVLSNLFGGWADKVRYTFRPDAQNQQIKDNIYGVGSKVLILCLNGDTDNAIILGGVPDMGTKPQQKEVNQGHNLFFEFNGTQFTINKDGELKLTFRGATNTDGTLADGAVKEAEGSYIQINKEGDIKIATPSDNQFININHKDKKLEMQAQAEWDVTIKGTCNITADQNVNIQSSGVKVGAATDSWMLGTTYRSAETQLNTQLGVNNATLSGLMTLIGTSLTTATVLNAVPVVGGALAAVPFGIAAGAILSASPIFSAMQVAQTSFEAQSATYLSKKNLTD